MLHIVKATLSRARGCDPVSGGKGKEHSLMFPKARGTIIQSHRHRCIHACAARDEVGGGGVITLPFIAVTKIIRLGTLPWK